MTNRAKRHYYIAICAVVIACIVALGLGSKAYTGWNRAWVNNFLGDVLYEMAWIWFIGAIKPRWKVSTIAIATFLITSLVEFSQLIAFPHSWKAQLWWRLLLGTHFTWIDFIYYAAGCVVGAASLLWLKALLDTVA